MKNSNKYKHSKSFYTTQFVKFKGQLDEKGVVNPFRNLNEFISSYEAIRKEGVTNIQRVMIYNAQYNTAYNTAMAEYKMANKLGIKVKLENLKLMTTQEFAEKYQTEIMHAYRSYLRQGKSASQAKDLISQYWFGSK